jgi:hypothetical protein
MKVNHHVRIILFASFLPLFAQSQTDSSGKGTTTFKLGLYYNSHLNYYGRTDSLRSSGIFPVAELWLDKHYYITAAPVFVHNTVSDLDYAGTVVTAGYMFRNNKWAGNTYLVKPIYKANSQLVQSALKFQATSTFSWLNKYINVSAGGDIKYSDKLDYGATAGLDHLFRFEPGEMVLVIDPSVYINAGTQQFTKTSYKQSGFLFFPGTLQQVNEEVMKFVILSWELSMPVVVAKGKFQFILNPAYVLPKNLVMVPSRPDLSERGKDMFYITAGAKVSF